MRSILFVCAMAAAAACGGGSSGDRTTGPVTGTEATAQVEVTRVLIAVEGQKMGEIVIHPDGTLELHGKDEAGKGKVDDAEVSVDGEVVARRDASGQVTARQRQREVVDGRVVDEQETWEPVATLQGDVATIAKDGSQIRIEGGKVVGIPAEAQVDIDVELADPAQADEVLFVVLAIFTASDMSSETSGPAKATEPPRPATP